MRVDTPWRAGAFQRGEPRLLFGCMYEDPAVELRAFVPGSRVFAIASAGCTARALAAAGHRVTAVDINPCQIDYARARAAGAPPVVGDAERLLNFGRRLLGLVGWTEARRRAFLDLADPAEQADYWRRTLDTARWRSAIDLLLSPRLLRLFYAGRFHRRVAARFRPASARANLPLLRNSRQLHQSLSAEPAPLTAAPRARPGAARD